MQQIFCDNWLLYCIGQSQKYFLPINAWDSVVKRYTTKFLKMYKKAEKYISLPHNFHCNNVNSDFKKMFVKFSTEISVLKSLEPQKVGT